jgi:hypothetical protein
MAESLLQEPAIAQCVQHAPYRHRRRSRDHGPVRLRRRGLHRCTRWNRGTVRWLVGARGLSAHWLAGDCERGAASGAKVVTVRGRNAHTSQAGVVQRLRLGSRRGGAVPGGWVSMTQPASAPERTVLERPSRAVNPADRHGVQMGRIIVAPATRP